MRSAASAAASSVLRPYGGYVDAHTGSVPSGRAQRSSPPALATRVRPGTDRRAIAKDAMQRGSTLAGVITPAGVTIRRVCLPELADRLVHAATNETAAKLLTVSSNHPDQVDLAARERAEILAVPSRTRSRD